MPSKKKSASPYSDSPASSYDRFGAIVCNLDDAEGLLEILSTITNHVNNSCVDEEAKTRLWHGMETLHTKIFELVSTARDTTDCLQLELSKTGGAR
jgi:hypothetical protein